MNEQISIGFSRRLVSAFAVLFAVLAVTGAWRAISSHNMLQLVIVLVAFGGLYAAFAAQLFRRDPVLRLDEEGITDLRGGVAVRWEDIEVAHVTKRQSAFDRYHHLVMTVSHGQTLSVSLDQLTSKWSEIAMLVESRLGKQVPVRREGVLRRPARLRSLGAARRAVAS